MALFAGEGKPEAVRRRTNAPQRTGEARQGHGARRHPGVARPAHAGHGSSGALGEETTRDVADNL